MRCSGAPIITTGSGQTVDVWKPSVTVAAVIEQSGRFLLVEEEADGRLVLNQPAGHLEPGESLAAACVREVLEETAYRFEPESLVGIYRWRYEPRDVTFLRFAFSGSCAGPVPGLALDREIVRLHWLTEAELVARSADHRSPLVLQCVRDYLAGRRYPVDVISGDYA
jgi:8-oxo-dGTP pyrophosphatase MutT (NUDIX family)